MITTAPVPSVAGKVSLPSDSDVEATYLLDRSHWLVRSRWVSVAGVIVVAVVASSAGFIATQFQIISVAVTMAAYNLYFYRRNLATRPDATPVEIQRPILLQLFFDVAALTLVLHWSDGVENPFSFFFTFPLTLGAMLLTRRSAFLLAFGAIGLHGGAVVLESVRVLTHHPLALEPVRLADAGTTDPFWHEPFFVLAHLVAFVAMAIGVVVFVRAIEERRRQAEARRREHERVALSRQRLAHVGELSAGVAHSIRNPLHGLLNCVDILGARDGHDASARETLAMMADGLHRIEVVTRRLLALGSEVPLRPVPTDVDALVRDSLKFVSVRSRTRNVTVRATLGGVGEATIDPERFGEALVNVIDNAVDASPDGGNVVVSTRRVAGENPGLEVDVVDEGSGIAAEHMARIFDPFFTTKPVGQGTGLGLAITRRILEEHGAHLAIDSTSQGTRVGMRIPTR